ncbi:Prohibitin domain-containing protein [Rozella allomycis CSF55]|uniref:Prohibitin domain-containing protein n=1 Tax=Rozella allomycis (strain CSF55) TaxID=988480 RepID=A0A075B0N7_ROZAC|nr:Prohibitin domain-containing protein [Rozella allomycis CSF55]|eukprot:EPZ34534.1 Prohibitin domain-containing protein [Rozella allomycis CSF55]
MIVNNILDWIARMSFPLGLGAFGASIAMYNVDGGERAVIFDRFRGVLPQVVGEGTHFLIPGLQRAIMFDIRTKPRNIATTTGSKDMQMISLTLRVLHRPEISHLPSIYSKLGTDYDERVLPSIGNEVLKAVVAQFDASELITQREIKIVFVKTKTHLTFGKEFTNAVEQKQVEAERAKFIVEKAEQEKSAAIIRAEGEAQAASLISNAMEKYGRGLIELRKIEAAKEISATLAESSNVSYLPSQGQETQNSRGGVNSFLAKVLKILVVFWTIKFVSRNKSTFLLHVEVGAKNEADVSVYLSDKPTLSVEGVDPAFQFLNATFGSWDEEKRETATLELPDTVVNNGTLYAHIKVSYSKKKSFIVSKVENLRSLLDNDSNEIKQENGKTDEIVSALHPNITINIIPDFTKFQGGLPSYIHPFLRFQDNKRYQPIIFVNEFWKLRDDYVHVNETTSFENSFKQNEALLGAESGLGLEDIKRMLRDTNPYFLALTFTVSILHTIFDILAFKNGTFNRLTNKDIEFWRARQNNLKGLSIKTVMINIFSQLIILLYLIENETSWMVIFSMLGGLVIEIWKLRKAVNVTIFRFSLTESYSKSLTRQYDDQAITYLTIASIPLLIGYSIYSLLYNQHKGWYSFVIGTLVGFVYAFEHMPWRTFMYKALGTVVDDLFAFIIVMPTMHRIACFRDGGFTPWTRGEQKLDLLNKTKVMKNPKLNKIYLK